MYKLCFVGTLSILHLLAPANSFRMDPVFNVTGDDASNASDAATSGGRVVQFSSTPPEVVGMELVSRGIPLYTATDSASRDDIRDMSMPLGWDSVSLPTWAAFDLSTLSVSQKPNLLLSAYAPRSFDYELLSDDSAAFAPASYVVEVNNASGGGRPPSDGWTAVVAVGDNLLNTMQHTFSLTDNNWVRFRVVSAIGGAPSVILNIDIYTFNGSMPSDNWLFMGDSITHMALVYPASNIQNLVGSIENGRWPAYIEDGTGGRSTGTAQIIIASRLASFSGKYVALCYGTNDSDSGFQMESLVRSVIASGKIPVVPRMPWSDTLTEEYHQPINRCPLCRIPTVLRGPDLWTIYGKRTDLIPSGDVSPSMKLDWNCGAKVGQMLSLLNLDRVAIQSEVSEPIYR